MTADITTVLIILILTADIGVVSGAEALLRSGGYEDEKVHRIGSICFWGSILILAAVHIFFLSCVYKC